MDVNNKSVIFFYFHCRKDAKKVVIVMLWCHFSWQYTVGFKPTLALTIFKKQFSTSIENYSILLFCFTHWPFAVGFSAMALIYFKMLLNSKIIFCSINQQLQRFNIQQYISHFYNPSSGLLLVILLKKIKATCSKNSFWIMH